jgi:hypothetical protein
VAVHRDDLVVALALVQHLKHANRLHLRQRGAGRDRAVSSYCSSQAQCCSTMVLSVAP